LVSSDRTLIARIAAHERWAREPDRSAATAPARQANADRYLNAARTLNPNLSDDELRVRAANLRSADMTRLARARWAKPDKAAGHE
jgi:DNA-nicking Smr family endonuclease